MKQKDHTSFYLVLATILSGMICAISGYLMPHLPLVWQISGGVTVLLLVTTVFLERDFLKKLFSKRTTLYGLNSLVMSVLFLAIVVIVNMIVFKYDWKKDLTKNKLHTLSEQSVKVVKGLESEVRLLAFISPMQQPAFEQAFEKYTYYSQKLKPQYVDVDRDPVLVNKYEIKRLGTIVVESDTRTARVDNLSGPEDPKLEEKLTNAIIQVAKGTKKKVYFLSGHGERLPSDTSENGYSKMKESLTSSRYNVDELVLLDKESIPADAEILIIPAPRTDYLPHELNLLEGYLNKGGKVLVLLEPDSTGTIQPLLAKYGVNWTPGKTVLEFNVLQRMSQSNPLTPLVTDYDKTHEITSEMAQPTIFSVTTPIEKTTNAPEGTSVSSLFKTSAQSFVIALNALEQLKGKKVNIAEKAERPGPVDLAVAVSGKVKSDAAVDANKDATKEEADAKKEPTDYRLVVVGDADFAGNSLRTKGLNSDLFQNMLSWLSEEEDLIAVRARPSDESKLEITEARFRWINLISIMLAPLISFLAGVGVWFKRRRA